MTTTAVRTGADLVAPPEQAVLPDAQAGATVAEIVGALGDVEGLIRSATAWRTELLEAARRMVAADPQAILAPELAADVWSNSDGVELAHRALVADVATTLSVHERTAARLFDEAQVLVGGLPATVAGMRAGTVSYRHAQALVEHTADLDPADRHTIETETLPCATTMPPGRFGRHVQRVRERRLAEPVGARHQRAATHRSVRIEPARDGMAFLTAYLPAATACAAWDRLDRAVDTLREPDESRTTDQLRADVLAALLLDDGTLDHTLVTAATLDPAALDVDVTDPAPPAAGGAVPADVDGPGDRPHAKTSDRRTGASSRDDRWRAEARDRLEHLRTTLIEPDDSPPRIAATRATIARLARGIVPHVTVTVAVVTLLRALASTDDDPTDLTDPTDQDDAAAGRDGPDHPVVERPPDVAHLDGYGPIDDHTATVLAAHAPSFRRVLTHPHTGAVLAIGRDTYVVPADLRAYLRLRDQTCRFPGCSRAADRCDVDHTTAYVSGGTTDATNLAHLCRTHHRLKHGTRWDVHQTGTDGTLTWTSPTGRRHRSRPALDLPAPPDAEGPPPF
ncbi:DUF222 domain-containing protein [Luteimicrobium sp. NPDC057192]|uniref:HNH endonuclease signature motif containing protein n=1 Tax=Luteimicrobium sp. NPDC057192 TaxID=3346042 RepID=UPI00362CDB5B